MKKVSSITAAQALLTGATAHVANREVTADGRYLLFGNLIATKTKRTLKVTCAGWATRTTFRSLADLMHVAKKPLGFGGIKGVPYVYNSETFMRKTIDMHKTYTVEALIKLTTPETKVQDALSSV